MKLEKNSENIYCQCEGNFGWRKSKRKKEKEIQKIHYRNGSKGIQEKKGILNENEKT